MTASVRKLIVTAIAAGAVLLVGVALVVMWRWPQNTTGPCVVANRSLLPGVPETSGLAVSRRTPGLLWTHNDSGNEAVLFAIDASGTDRGRVRLPIRTRDWEDVSAASRLYTLLRDHIQLYYCT